MKKNSSRLNPWNEKCLRAEKEKIDQRCREFWANIKTEELPELPKGMPLLIPPRDLLTRYAPTSKKKKDS